MNKLIKDGRVAVIVSPGFGAGWSTWNQDLGEDALFDKDMVEAILRGESPMDIAIQKYPEAYHGGLVRKVEVEWLPLGTRFEIDEYDGSESLRILSPADGFIA